MESHSITREQPVTAIPHFSCINEDYSACEELLASLPAWLKEHAAYRYHKEYSSFLTPLFFSKQIQEEKPIPAVHPIMNLLQWKSKEYPEMSKREREFYSAVGNCEEHSKHLDMLGLLLFHITCMNDMLMWYPLISKENCTIFEQVIDLMNSMKGEFTHGLGYHLPQRILKMCLYLFEAHHRGTLLKHNLKRVCIYGTEFQINAHLITDCLYKLMNRFYAIKYETNCRPSYLQSLFAIVSFKNKGKYADLLDTAKEVQVYVTDSRKKYNYYKFRVFQYIKCKETKEKIQSILTDCSGEQYDDIKNGGIEPVLNDWFEKDIGLLVNPILQWVPYIMTLSYDDQNTLYQVVKAEYEDDMRKEGMFFMEHGYNRKEKMVAPEYLKSPEMYQAYLASESTVGPVEPVVASSLFK